MPAKGATRPHGGTARQSTDTATAITAVTAAGHPDPPRSGAGMPAVVSAVAGPAMAGSAMDALLRSPVLPRIRSRGRPPISRAAASQPQPPLPSFNPHHSQQPPPSIPAPAPAPVTGSLDHLNVMAHV